MPTVLIENNCVRVTAWRFEQGAATGWHRHDYDYVVVPLTTGPLVLDERDGKRVAELTTGVPYFREAGVEHDVANGTDGEFVFVQVEVKRSRAR